MPRNKPSTTKTKTTRDNAGRPTTYKPEYCEMLVAHMRGLGSFESFGNLVQAHRDTLYEWAKVHPEFSDAKKRGRAALVYGLENVGKGLMTGKLRGNVVAWIFFMKNCAGWRDDPIIEEDEIEGLEFIYE